MDDPKQLNELYADVEWALSEGLPATEVIFALDRLKAAAPKGSGYELYTNRYLAEALLERAPFRALKCGRRALELEEDACTFACVGIAHLSLKNDSSAELAFRGALRLEPENPWYAHNLGHILDTCLNRSEEALKWLESAHRALPDDVDVLLSLAHAVFRVQGEEPTRNLLLRAFEGSTSEVEGRLRSWRIEESQGAAGSE
ncbi:MAG: hypothetical protein MK135_05730 [Polyangiaceae bacterium]|nr:hypothetical protein [Polyangiaceae bacterium]